MDELENLEMVLHFEEVFQWIFAFFPNKYLSSIISEYLNTLSLNGT
jgi:hypothetical protein